MLDIHVLLHTLSYSAQILNNIFQINQENSSDFKNMLFSFQVEIICYAVFEEQCLTNHAQDTS